MQTNSHFPGKGKSESSGTLLPKYASINPAKESLTPSILRKLSGNHSLTDDEASHIIQTINKLTSIFLELARLKNIYCIDNQQDVYLIPDPEPEEPLIELNPLTKKNAA